MERKENLTGLAKKLGFNVGLVYAGPSQLGSKTKGQNDKYKEVEWKYEGDKEDEEVRGRKW